MAELVLLPLQRTFVSNLRPQGRAGNNLYAGMDPHGCLYRMLLQFDTSMLPENCRIVSAVLKACAVVPNQNANGFFTPYPVLSAWNRRVTWETQPAFDAYAAGNTVEIDCNGWYVWDITRVVEDWAHKKMNNNGVMIKSAEEEEPDLTCFEIVLSHNQNCCSPALYVRYDLECIPPFRHNRVKNVFEICRAGDETAYSSWQNTSAFKVYTYSVQNMGPDGALIRVQISPNQSVPIDEAAERELAPGEKLAIVPQKYAFFTRLAVRAESPGSRCKLKIWFQAQG